MSAPQDFYQRLHVAPGADPEVIEAAYRVLAARLPAGDERLARLTEAYEALRDPAQRAAHDRALAAFAASGDGPPAASAWPLGLAFAGALAILVATGLHFRSLVRAEAPGPAAPSGGPAPAGAAQTFGQKCAGCHGANGGGGLGPSLAGVEAKGDAFIRTRILDGSPTKGMPAFRDKLADREVDELVRYVKGL